MRDRDLPLPLRFPCWRTLRKTAGMLPWNRCAPAPPLDGDYGAALTPADVAADLMHAIVNGNAGNPNDRSTWDMRRAAILIRWRFVRRMRPDEREWIRHRVVLSLARRLRRLAENDARAKAKAGLQPPRLSPKVVSLEGLRETPYYAEVQLTEAELRQLNRAKRWYWQCCYDYASNMTDARLQSRILAYEAYFAVCDKLAGIVRLPPNGKTPWPGRRDPRFKPRCTNAHIDGFADRHNFTFKLEREDGL